MTRSARVSKMSPHSLHDSCRRTAWATVFPRNWPLSLKIRVSASLHLWRREPRCCDPHRTFDSVASSGVSPEKPSHRLPARRPCRQMELIENHSMEQRLAKKARPRLRVICATPIQKRRTPTVPSGSFVACAESFGNCDGATEGGIPRSPRL
jgi:hypothetical protein